MSKNLKNAAPEESSEPYYEILSIVEHFDDNGERVDCDYVTLATNLTKEEVIDHLCEIEDGWLYMYLVSLYAPAASPLLEPEYLGSANAEEFIEDDYIS